MHGHCLNQSGGKRDWYLPHDVGAEGEPLDLELFLAIDDVLAKVVVDPASFRSACFSQRN